MVLLSKAQHQPAAPAPPTPQQSAWQQLQQEELRRQVFLLEQQKRQLAQELAEAALKLEKGRLEAAEAARAQAQAQEEAFALRSRVQRLQAELGEQGAVGRAAAEASAAEVEALRAQLKGKEARLADGRRECARMVEALQARAQALERLALSLDGSVALKEGVRMEAAAIAREALACLARADAGGDESAGASGSAAASASSSLPGSPLRSTHQQPFVFPGLASPTVAPMAAASSCGSPHVVVLDAATLRAPAPAPAAGAGAASEGLRQENEALKGAKALVCMRAVFICWLLMVFSLPCTVDWTQRNSRARARRRSRPRRYWSWCWG